MKKRLDQFTMAQFIDIACGDYSSIGADPDTSKQVANSLLEQYNNMADPVSAKTRLLEDERRYRSDARIKLYRIFLNLINVYDAYDEVRDILLIIKEDKIARRGKDSLKAKIEQMLRSEESQYERMENERKQSSPGTFSEDEFRASFDMQTARLMAHFKFSINIETVSASVYANLVNMACKQQRQQATK